MNLIIRPISCIKGFNSNTHLKSTKYYSNKVQQAHGKQVLNSVETSDHPLRPLAQKILDRFHTTNLPANPVKLAERLGPELAPLINQWILQLDGLRQAVECGIYDKSFLLEDPADLLSAAVEAPKELADLLIGAAEAHEELTDLYELLIKHEYPIDSLSPTQRKYLKKHEKSPSQSGN